MGRKQCLLCEIVKFGNGKSRPNTEGIHPIYGGNGILGYTSETNYEGEIIVIGRVGAYCGATYYENRPVWVSDNALAAIPRENNNAKYLYYFLKNMDLNQHAQGSSHPLVTQTLLNLLDIEISYEEPEQKAIAAVLSSLDDKIDLLHRQNKTLEAMGETLFRQWFVEEANEDWEEGCLGDVIELVYGKGLKKEIRTGTGYPVIGSSGVVGYHSEFLVEGPGIVIGRKGTLGKVIYLWDNFFPIDTTYYIKSKAESAGLLYEYFLLKTLNFEEMNSDSAVPGLNRDIALSTEIEIAPLEKLNRFNQFASTFINKLRENTTQIRTLAKLRDTLLPKLMSGEVRVEYEN
ncbi:MAG: restriction endonuclease subunit S [Deltaproteobacteria bacterium]|nr:restriction endonuclease subunit S [Deltaproteobacteria bacterium]